MMSDCHRLLNCTIILLGEHLHIWISTLNCSLMRLSCSKFGGDWWGRWIEFLEMYELFLNICNKNLSAELNQVAGTLSIKKCTEWTISLSGTAVISSESFYDARDFIFQLLQPPLPPWHAAKEWNSFCLFVFGSCYVQSLK